MKMQRAFVRVMTTIFALLVPLSGYAAGKHSPPVLDEGEVDCSLGQNPPVYFLAGLAATEIPEEPVVLTGERSCTILRARAARQAGVPRCRSDPRQRRSVSRKRP